MKQISTEILETNLARQLGWVAAAETRISLIVPLATALFGSVAIKSGAIQASDPWDWFVSYLTLVLLTLVIITAIVAIFPRTDGPEHSLIFFGVISQKSAQEFQEAIIELTEDQYQNDLIAQIHINAKIASTKYQWIQKSMTLLLISFVPWALSVLHLY